MKKIKLPTWEKVSEGEHLMFIGDYTIINISDMTNIKKWKGQNFVIKINRAIVGEASNLELAKDTAIECLETVGFLLIKHARNLQGKEI